MFSRRLNICQYDIDEYMQRVRHFIITHSNQENLSILVYVYVQDSSLELQNSSLEMSFFQSGEILEKTLMIAAPLFGTS